VAAEYEVNIKINTQQVERDLKKVEKAVNNIGKGKGGKKQSVLALPSTEMLNATARKIQSLDKVNRKVELRQREINKQTRDQALNINTLVKTQDRRARLLNKINEMEAKGLNVKKLRAQLEKATNQQIARRFGSAEKEFRVLEKSIRLEQSKLRILKDQQKNFPSSPTRGTVSMAGSPAQIEAIKKLEMAEIRAAKNAHFAELRLIQKRQKIQMDNIDKELAKDIKALETFDRRLAASDDARAKRIAGAQIPGLSSGQTFGPAFAPMQGPRQMMASPVGGAANIPGSPAFLANQRQNERFEQVGLGAGFPLLFGGGAGSVLGGAAGGLTGSFGAQIAFSALGQQIDQMVASVMNAGKAFGSLSETLDLIRERSLFTSKDSEELARQLEELGDVEGLAELATIELASKIGSEGIGAFQDLEAEIDEFDRLVGSLVLSLQAFLAGPLTGFLNILNATLGKQVTRGTVDRLAASLTDPAGRERFLAEATKQIGTQTDITGFGFGSVSGLPRSETGLKPASLDLLSDLQRRVAGGEEFGPSTLLSRKLKITKKDRESFKPGSGVEKAAREEERLQKRLAKLEEERQKVMEISRFKDQIAAAEAADDAQLVIRLQGEQKMAEIEASRKQALVGITDQREIDAINIGKATEKLATQRETERQITEEQRQRQELFQNTVADLEHQLALAQATSEAERERLRIEKKLQELREDGMSEGQIGQVGDLLKQISAENSPLNQFINQSVESLNNLEAHAVQVSQGIGNAIGNSLVSGMQGLVTGATSVKQVFADMLRSIADVLAQQASQMIATYIAIGIARAFAGMGGGESTTPPSTMPGGASQTGLGLNINGVDQGINPFGPGSVAVASGGYISSPTRALVGEGGQGEYVIPESKMRESMTRYSRGARGSSVIPEAGGSGTSGEGGGTAVAAPIDVRYTVERINSVDYVTADQFQSGMQSAAAQGAQRGEQNTLKRLQMSGGTRKRLGL